MEVAAFLPTRQQGQVLDIDHAVDQYLLGIAQPLREGFARLGGDILGMNPGKAATGQRTFAAMVIDFAGHLLQFPPGLDRLLRIQTGLAHGGTIDEQNRQGQSQRQRLQAPAGIVDRIEHLRERTGWHRASGLPRA
jgi:hypothetical protein